MKAADAKIADLHRLPLPCASILVAEAIDPDDPNRVLREFVSETGPGPLLLQIARSGLVTGIGHGLWIGRECERVWTAGRKTGWSGSGRPFQESSRPWWGAA
jgi:hypothetical protein